MLKLECVAAARLCSRSVNAKGSPVSCLTLSVFAHIVRLVMPYSKRLLLSRGYLIVRGRRCFQESFFRPIKVAVNLGTSCLFLPDSVSHTVLLTVQFITPTLYPGCRGVGVLCLFCLIGQKVQVRSMRTCFRMEAACSSCLHVQTENRALAKTCIFPASATKSLSNKDATCANT